MSNSTSEHLFPRRGLLPLRQLFASKTKSPSFRLKEFKAKLIRAGKFKPLFETTKELFVEVQESIMNVVDHVSEEVRLEVGIFICIGDN